MKPSRKMRFAFALIGAAVALVAALLAEAPFGMLRTGDWLARRNAPSLLFVDDFGRRLQREGGRTGDVRITLVWNNRNDLDLWCDDPSGERIFYGHPVAASGGRLDVDMNANPAATSDQPVENVFWPAGDAPRGKYRVFVHHYRNHGAPDPTAYEVEIYNHGVRQTFRGQISSGDEAHAVATFNATTGPRPSRVPAGFWQAVTVAALWTALLAAALFGGLAGGLYRIFGRPPLRRRWWARRAAIAAAWGLAAGALGQALFALLLARAYTLPEGLPRALGWLALAVALGAGLCRVTPCMPRRRALACAAVGGVAAFFAFQAALPSGDAPARLAAAAVLGAAIGYAITVVLPDPRPAPEPARPAAGGLRARSLQPTGILRFERGGPAHTLAGLPEQDSDPAAPFADPDGARHAANRM